MLAHEPLLLHIWPGESPQPVPAASQVWPAAQPVIVPGVHVVAHAVPPAQPRWLGQAAVPPPLQVPEPLQVPAAVNIEVAPLHDAMPPLVVLLGYWHAPPLSQPVAPQVEPVVQAALQQLPVPLSPQTLLAHWPLLVHVLPPGLPTHLFILQSSDEQSPLAWHILPSPQAGQVPPPQSVSVSVPFSTPSLQLGVWQVPFLQTPLLQSGPPLHILPSSQAGQVPPPQSVSVSVPSWLPSVHEAFTHLPLPSQTVPLLSLQVVPLEAGVETHMLPVQATLAHAVVLAVQSPVITQATQVPLPSHTAPPLSVQGASMAAGVVAQQSLVQVLVTQAVV